MRIAHSGIKSDDVELFIVNKKIVLSLVALGPDSIQHYRLI